MGYTERDYYREDVPGEGTGGIYLQSMVVRLIIINVVIFLADWITAKGPEPSGHWLASSLAMHGDTIAQPKLWYQLLTAGFVHNFQPDRLFHIIGNMIGLYLFGKAIEERLGKREFLAVYLLAIFLGNLVWGLRQYFLVGPSVGDKGIEQWATCVGASGGVTALIVLFCLYNPRATLLLFFAIPTPAWLAGILIVVFDLIGAATPLRKTEHIAFDVHLAGAAFAWAYWYMGWNFGRLPGLRGLARMGSSLGKMMKPRPDVRLHDPEASYEDLEEEADRLLQKVGQHGEASLTPKERKILEDYSRRMRQKHR